MELQYQITKEQLIVPMPKEVDHHIAKTISREIDFIIDSWLLLMNHMLQYDITYQIGFSVHLSFL